MSSVSVLNPKANYAECILNPMITATPNASSKAINLGTSAIQAASAQNRLLFFIYLSLIVGTALGTALLTYLLYRSGNKVQDAIVTDANARIAEADQKAAEANENAGRANERANNLEGANLGLRIQVATLETNAANASKDLASLQKAAADAKAQQQEVEKELAVAKRDTANAQTQAENATRAAEYEHITRLELEKTLRPRELLLKVYEDETSNIDDLKNLGEISVLLEYVDDAEAKKTAYNLKFLFEKSGWKVTIRPTSEPQISSGISIETLYHHPYTPLGPSRTMETRSAEICKVIRAWLLNNDWEVGGEQPDGPGKLQENDIGVVVGLKPNPYFEDIPEEKSFKQKARAELERFAPNANPTNKRVEQYVDPSGAQFDIILGPTK